MGMTIDLDDRHTEALRQCAAQEGRSTDEVVLAAIDAYLAQAEDNALTEELAAQGARRFADLLRRLGE